MMTIPRFAKSGKRLEGFYCPFRADGLPFPLDELSSPSASLRQRPRFAHPEAEHLLPLMVALGAGGDDGAVCDYRDHVLGWAVSGFRFG